MNELQVTSQAPCVSPLGCGREADVAEFEGVFITAAPAPFSKATKLFMVEPGLTIEQMLGRIVPQTNYPLVTHVYLGPDYITPDMYSKVRLKKYTHLTVNVLPQGGGGGGGKKNPLATILSLAVVVAAAWAGPLVAGAILGSTAAGTVGFSALSAVVSAGVATLGGLLVAAIAPPSKPRLDTASGRQDRSESPTLFIEGARNNANPFGVIPVVLGRHRMVPPLAALNYSESVADDQYVRQLFCWGYGHVNVYNRKIGETLVSEFDDFEVEDILDGTSEVAAIPLYPNSVIQEALSIQLKQPDGWIVRTTQPNTDEISIDLTFPKGLVQYDDQGNRNNRTCVVEIRYAPTGTTSWSPTYTETFTHATAMTVRRSKRFTDLANGTYDVAIRRITVDAGTDRIFDEVWWTALKSVTYENPVRYEGLSLTATRIRATDQLNGAIDQYNGEPFSVIPDWDSGTGSWIIRETNNPASIFRYIAQNSPEFGNIGPNARPLADTRMDLAGIEEWHEYCVAQGLEYNTVVDFQSSVWERLVEVAAAGHAALSLVDNKWSVIVEKQQTVVAQHFTDANTWGYRAERVFTAIPHALRISFINEEKGYIQDERIVYDDGYSAANATEIQQVEFPGITKPSLIWKFGRRYLAMLRLRPIVHSFYVDTEHLIASRGALVKFSHTVPLIGAGSGFVVSVQTDGMSPNKATGVVLDSKVTMELGKSYAIRFRATDNVSLIKEVTTIPGETNILIFKTPFALTQLTIDETPDERLTAEDIMWAFGESGKETSNMIIKAILPSDDLTAQVFLIDESPAIFTADTGTIPAFDSNISLPPEMSRPQAPIILSIQTGAEVQVINLDGSITTRMVVTLINRNLGEVVPIVKVRKTGEDNLYYAAVITATPNRVILEGFDAGSRYDLEVRYRRNIVGELTGLMNNQISLPAQQSNILFVGVEGRPADVTGFQLQIIGSIAMLLWDKHRAIDFDHYEIRFTPDTVTPTWGAAQVFKNTWYGETLVVPLQLGTYLIKAYDKQGQDSENAATASTDLTAISGMNTVITINEHPSFAGTKTNLVIDGGTGNLELDDIALGVGTYECANIIDLGDVYSATLNPRIIAGGRNSGNTMDAWPALNMLTSLSGTDDGAWEVTAYVSLTNDDPGGSPAWGAWQPLNVSEYSFRAAKFKVDFEGNGSNVTPSVEEISFTADMPDRIVTGELVTSTIVANDVVYDAPFQATPTIVITIKDQVAGDVLSITSESEAGFTVSITNAAVLVERNITYHVVGYGRKQI